jgi:cyclase
MNSPLCYRRLGITILLLSLGSMGDSSCCAQDLMGVTEITANLLLFATDNGNVLASVGPDGVLIVGTPAAASTPQISSVLAGRTSSPVRYVVIAPQDLAHSQGDAGWGRRGAFVAMQENALQRLGGHAMGPPGQLPSRLVQLGVDRPRLSFSQVLSFDINGEAIHIVHQPPGYSDADAIVHFHVANTVYLGEVFPGDGYPMIDPAQGGNLDGLVKTLGSWTGGTFRIVPARGSVTNGANVEAFQGMIVTVRGHVQKMIDAGQTESQVLAARPTSEFDDRWGHGRVPPEIFVREVYAALSSQNVK